MNSSSKDLKYHISSLKEEYMTKEKVRVAVSDLIVTDAFFKGSNFDDLLKENRIESELYNYRWNDKILHDLSKSKLDIAVYNRARAEKFIKEHGVNNLEIVDTLCHSMGGDNFYLIGKKDYWEEKTLEDLLSSINQETVIVTAKNSDNIDNLSAIGITAKNAKIVDLPTENLSSEIFEIRPEILISGNQNLRYNLLYNDDFVEVITTNSIKDKFIKAAITNNSENVFVVNKLIYNSINRSLLLSIIKLARENFNHSLSNNEKLQDLTSEIYKSINGYVKDHSHGSYIIRQILYKTYRFGSPL